MNTDEDKLIREALRKVDDRQIEPYRDEPAILEIVVQTFRSRQRWLVALVFLLLMVFVVLMFACGYQFFAASTTRGQIGWATGFLYFAIAISMMKIWYWGEMRRYTVLREIKRVELQVARLAERLENDRA